MAEAELIAARREKLSRLRALGIDPFPYRFERTHTAGEVKTAFPGLDPEARTGTQVRLAGRIMALRQLGRISFAVLQDRTGSIQLFASQASLGEEPYRLFCEGLDLGDIVGAWGEVITTRTGELSVELAGFAILAKALRPLPEKWHGLRDVEKRYRHRALDLIVNQDGRRILAQRALIIRTIREYLDERGFLEVETPILQPIPGGATARPFVTHHNALDQDLYLRIAPELYLKRLLVGGLERVYEIGKNFRNEGISTTHNPEYTGLEAYEAYADYEDAMELAEEMIERCVLAVSNGKGLRYGGREVDFSRPWRRVPLLELVAETSGVDPEKPLPQLLEELERKGIEVPDHLRGGPKGKVIEHLLETQAEPTLWNPTFVVDYPVDISPLAKRKRGRPDLTERFELYIAGMEIANAFSELNDPEEQRQRFLAQERLRACGDEEAQRIDEDFLRDLEQGMPPAAGIGIGIDRLVMVLTGATSIREVIAFPLVGQRR
ncbi:MAG: Lysine--tRNA ligase [Acetothermia bacterium 64_32]|nr:MAG: Lysine--tRNA ligase [Acetothermia bacterium 64_32]HAF71159.1 lysine--tRNA ligase [Candidatus Acetothermia bacterium]